MSSSSWRSTPLPADWQRTRRRILRRDSHICQRCGDHATHVDHVLAAHLGGSDDDANLQALCEPCHRRKTGREARAAQPSRKRPAERHPGEL